ncbi:hypothetical protein CTAYLR_008581 [Chrysophaeum taylorii]|uniref:Uncharacterized protein n=1 Tax=Chrysophaeum taylorii TaxID=2483200 RepID=A0AAD7UGQ4_9STRA|nr:hypothetical protein CTAYLR_008581 [Chrysophaeum taylorii]
MWQRLVRWHRNGTLLFATGGIGLAACGALYLRDREYDRDTRYYQQLNIDLERLRQDQEKRLKERREKATFSDARPLFAATVERRVHPSVGFDGPVALTNVHVGDTVWIIEQDVGPESAYHMCRNDFGEGLYPKAYLLRKAT